MLGHYLVLLVKMYILIDLLQSKMCFRSGWQMVDKPQRINQSKNTCVVDETTNKLSPVGSDSMWCKSWH